MIEPIKKARDCVLATKPLVLNITNYVTMDLMANGLLALGAAPVMSACDKELEALVQICHAVNLNIGTLDDALIKRCELVARLAQRYHKPVILDPVGAGASHIRTKTVKALLPYVDIMRGNASEIMSLVDADVQTLGVESTHASMQARAAACGLATKFQITVVVSGEIDYVTDGTQEIMLSHGSAVMPLVTGMGCLLTAVIAAFRGVMDDSFEAASVATAYYGLCGAAAEKISERPGTFRVAFIDALHEGIA